MTTEEVIERMKKYCAGAERSTHDVQTKLEELDVPESSIQQILRTLHDEKFIDDTRYANAYTSEKLNLDLWGRAKITDALRKKNIDERIIHKAIGSIDEREYLEKLHLVLQKKYRDVKSDNAEDDAKRVRMFALSRGFEEDLITEWLESNVLS